MWWSWLQSGWLFLLIPLAMMAVCILMCVFVCGFRSRGCGAYCGGMQHTQDRSVKQTGDVGPAEPLQRADESRPR